MKEFSLKWNAIADIFEIVNKVKESLEIEPNSLIEHMKKQEWQNESMTQLLSNALK
jgi:hypothetical protein